MASRKRVNIKHKILKKGVNASKIVSNLEKYRDLLREAYKYLPSSSDFLYKKDQKEVIDAENNHNYLVGGILFIQSRLEWHDAHPVNLKKK